MITFKMGDVEQTVMAEGGILPDLRTGAIYPPKAMPIIRTYSPPVYECNIHMKFADHREYHAVIDALKKIESECSIQVSDLGD